MSKSNNSTKPTYPQAIGPLELALSRAALAAAIRATGRPCGYNWLSPRTVDDPRFNVGDLTAICGGSGWNMHTKGVE